MIAVLALRNPKSNVAAGPTSAVASSSSPGSSATTSPGKTATSSGTSSSHSTHHRGPSGSSTSSSAAADGNPKSIPLIVLNNTTIGGLAKGAAQRFEDGGWTVTATDNLQNNILSTCAYYDPNVAGAHAAADALQQQFPTIRRVKERFAELPDGPIVVVLTSDYSSE